MVIQHTGELKGIKAAAKVFLQAAQGTAVPGGPWGLAGSGFGSPCVAKEGREPLWHPEPHVPP